MSRSIKSFAIAPSSVQETRGSIDFIRLSVVSQAWMEGRKGGEEAVAASAWPNWGAVKLANKIRLFWLTRAA